MKNIKVIFFLFIFFILTACSSNSIENGEPLNNIPEEIAEAATESYYDKLGKRDFEGDTFTVLDANDYPEWHQNFAEEINGESINDALYERNKFIESEYNVIIEYNQIKGGGAGCSALEKNVLAGSSIYDMIISLAQGGTLEKLAVNGILYNLADAPYLSLQSPWWSKLLNDNMLFNNQLYFTLGDIVPSTYLTPGVMYVNLKLMQDYGIEQNLYDLVFNGKWTLDTIAAIIKDQSRDLNQDNKMHADDDFFGIISPDNGIISNIYAAGLGIKLSTIKNNKIEVDWVSPSALEKIDKLSDLLVKPAYNAQNDVITNTFHNGRSMFLVHTLEAGMLFLRDMEDDFGVLPMPKFDENQPGYISFISAWVSAFPAIPSNADIEKSAFLMEAMGYAGYEMIRPNIYEKALKLKVARDSESAQAIDIIIESCYMDLNGLYNFGGSNDIIRAALFDKKPVVSAYEAKESAIQKAIDNYIESISFNK